MATSKKNGKNGNGLIVAKQYSVTRTDNVLEALKENLGEDTLSVNDLDKIKIPAGGGTQWEVPDLDEDDGLRHAKELKGIIVWFTDRRAYYKKSIQETGGGEVPDCFSNDCKLGEGDPGGVCRHCPMSQFGTAKGGEGKGQACKMMRLVYFAVENEKLPAVFVLPPTSLRVMKTYLQRLGSKDIKYWTTETVFTLEKAKNSSGIEYSRIIPRPSKRLDEDTITRFKAYREGLIPYLQIDASKVVQEEARRENAE